MITVARTYDGKWWTTSSRGLKSWGTNDSAAFIFPGIAKGALRTHGPEGAPSLQALLSKQLIDLVVGLGQ